MYGSMVIIFYTHCIDFEVGFMDKIKDMVFILQCQNTGLKNVNTALRGILDGVKDRIGFKPPLDVTVFIEAALNDLDTDCENELREYYREGTNF